MPNCYVTTFKQEPTEGTEDSLSGIRSSSLPDIPRKKAMRYVGDFVATDGATRTEAFKAADKNNLIKVLEKCRQKLDAKNKEIRNLRALNKRLMNKLTEKNIRL